MDPSYNDKLTIAKQSRTSEERATEKDDNAYELQSTRNFEDSQRNGMKNSMAQEDSLARYACPEKTLNKIG